MIKYDTFSLYSSYQHTLDPIRRVRAPTTRILVPVSPSGQRYFPNVLKIFIGGVGGGLSKSLSAFDFFLDAGAVMGVYGGGGVEGKVAGSGVVGGCPVEQHE